ncbi:MAG: universal stress protein [Ignavibacteria bacterium]|nr:universal stress protein [Ignavibacteria bacterium]
MKKILVPTDFSECSIQGLEFAAFLAGKAKAEIHIFNAAETSNYMYSQDQLAMAPPAAILMEGINENLRKASEARLNQIERKGFLKGLKVKTLCDVTTNIHASILDYSDKIKPAYIVMGSRGSSNVAKILLGSIAERVVRFSSYPVVVIPGKVAKPDLKSIIFASDFSKEAYGIFPVVKDFASLYKAEITLLKVNTMDQFSRSKDDSEAMSTFSRSFGGKYESVIYNDYMKEEGILNYLKFSGADLVAIGTHGKKGLRRFFSEDVSAGIVRLALKPILIVNLLKYKRKSDIRN